MEHHKLELRQMGYLTKMNDSNQIDSQLRELALIDRIIGLEAEVARLSVEAGIKDLRILHKSRAWKLGHFLLTPLVLAKKIVRK